jgi:hypothetical protein
MPRPGSATFPGLTTFPGDDGTPMARTDIPVQVPTRTGTTITFAAADGTNNNSFFNNGNRHLRIKNTGSTATATIRFGRSLDGVAATNGLAITVPATTGDVTTAVFPVDPYSQADGTVWIDWSATPTGVTIAVIEN